LASSAHAQAVAEPLVRPRPRRRTKAKARPRARGGIVWIAVSGILLVGVVFVNVAVLRLNISLDSANTQRGKLRAENAALQSELSSALASQRIQALARSQDGLVPASGVSYLNLAK
jgi:cell division protein FtsL